MPVAVPIIRVQNLTKSIASGKSRVEILRGVDFEVPAGQYVVIMGPSGSGKSTLLGLLAGLDSPTTGSIVLDGEEITGLGEDDLARLRGQKIGFVFQSYHLIPTLTAEENVLLPAELLSNRRTTKAGDSFPDATKRRPASVRLAGNGALRNGRDTVRRARELLDGVGLADRGHHYPVQLSGGEQQRVALARAFMVRPPILLADEPTGNLDSVNGHHILELLLKLNRQEGTTLLLVTHDQELASNADRRIQLRDGRIVADEGQGPG